MSLRTLYTRLLFPLRVWLAFALLALPAALVIIATPGQERRRAIARRTAKWVFGVGGIGLKISGLEHLPAGACLVAANHASYLDGIILTAALPPRFGFVIKREVTAAPLVGWLLARLGSEFVERFDKKSAGNDAHRLIRLARSGACLGVFPEGTFKRESGLRPFHLGAFMAATRAGLPVVPAAIRGARHILPAASWSPRPGNLEVELMLPVAPQGRSGEHARGLRDAVRARILEKCGEGEQPNPQDGLRPAS
ncbi:MAG TPA: lysophospholipid acyltransferase family protein [Gammaproteobacteria bacterium]|nr:lysophospholipid acyltransferase family protein [Gammaproteobacteria bacterium]